MMHGKLDSRELIIVSKYFVPANNVDSNSVYDLCVKLLNENKSLKIKIVTSDLKYKSDVKLRNFEESVLEKLEVHRIKSFSFKKNGSVFRIVNDLLLGVRLIKYARRLKSKYIISLSNPPLINTWCSLFLRRRIYIYWSFDLYPEALFASDIINENGFLGKLIDKLTYFRSPHAMISLGPNQFKYLSSKYMNSNIRKIILPCGIHQESKDENIPNWVNSEKLIIGYIGNLGKAHSRDFLINIIDQIHNYEKLKLVISVYGEYANEVYSFIKTKEKSVNIEVVNSVSQKQLSFIDVHLVSLLEKWTHVSVPSKAVSAVCSGSSLWFYGSQKTDTYYYFNKCSYISNSDSESVTDVLRKISEDDLTFKKAEASKIAYELHNIEKDSIKELLNLIYKK